MRRIRGVIWVRAFDGDSGDTGAPFGGGDASAGSGEPQHAVPLPDGVADAAAGVELATLLDGVPVERVSGYDTVTYLTAAYRLATHYHGLFLKALLETGLRLPAPDDQVVRTDTPGEFAAEEARAALVWSRSRAESTFARAYQMFAQHPVIGDALLDATIDEPRATAFCSWTAGLADEHADRIVDELLPAASTMTVSELIDRIKRMAIALDPDWAERRYRDSVRQRRIELRQTPQGTADLAGRDLPADRAKTGSDRIHTLAHTCKTAGDKRPIDTIRADLFLGMLDGRYQHMTDQQIINHVLTNPIADDPTDNDRSSNNNDGDGPTTDENDDGPPPSDDDDGPPPGDDDGGDSPRDGDGGGGSPSSGDNDTPSDNDRGGSQGDPTTGGGTPGGDPHPGNDDGNRIDPADTSGADDPESHRSRMGTASASAWNVRELRVELSTLLGLDQHPAELPGLGYIPAMVARPLAARMGAAQWRFVICTPDGIPICSGITTHRPTGQAGVQRDSKRGGIVELQLSSTQLFQLATATASGQHADWAQIISDIADRYRRGILDHTTTATTATNRPTNDTEPPDNAEPPDDQGDARRRRARAGLRRWIEVRDRYCLHPACRMPASQTDQDHRTDYAAGGLTIEQNLDSECRHDHNLQHDGHWRVHRPPGSDLLTGPLVWVSPLGHQYESRPPPVMHPYPEPGSHYPGENDLPEWFTNLIKKAKAAQQASARTAEAAGEPQNTADPRHTASPRRTATNYPAEPPF